MRAGDFGGPILGLVALHLHGEPASSAYQMVVVMRRAAPVDRFAGVGAQRVDRTGRRERLQRAVDRREADAFAASTQFVVELLCGAEVVDVFQQRGDRGALPGAAHPRAGHGVSSPAWVTASATMWA